MATTLKALSTARVSDLRSFGSCEAQCLHGRTNLALGKPFLQSRLTVQREAKYLRRIAATRRSVVASASAEESETQSPGYGLGGPGSFFGFGNEQERLVGRVAMLGFMAGIIMEILTGKGVVAQLGMDPMVVRYPILLGFTFLIVGGLLGGWVVIQNPPDFKKAPPNDGAGLPRDPLKTFSPTTPDPLTMYTRGGLVEKDGKMRREPFASDLDLPKK
jgi:hypothetical protein